MGTNFYIVPRDELKRRQDDDSIEQWNFRSGSGYTHIGKRSGGWVFLFQGGGECKTVAAWKQRILELKDDGDETIVDEYGTEHQPAEFWRDVVEATKHGSRTALTPLT